MLAMFVCPKCKSVYSSEKTNVHYCPDCSKELVSLKINKSNWVKLSSDKKSILKEKALESYEEVPVAKKAKRTLLLTAKIICIILICYIVFDNADNIIPGIIVFYTFVIAGMLEHTIRMVNTYKLQQKNTAINLFNDIDSV